MPNLKVSIAVSSGKGGVGKSTTAAGIAACYASQGYSVLLADLDVVAPNAHILAGIPPEALVVTGIPESLTMVFPISECLGFRVVSPLLNQYRMSSSDVVELVQCVAGLDVVVFDLPGGWTSAHTTVASVFPHVWVVPVAPTETSLADHSKHLADINKSHEQRTTELARTDKRRKWADIPGPAPVVVVETMSKFAGTIVDTGSDQHGKNVIVRRAGALPLAEVRSAATFDGAIWGGTLSDQPTVFDAARTNDMRDLMEIVDRAARPGA